MPATQSSSRIRIQRKTGKVKLPQGMVYCLKMTDLAKQTIKLNAGHSYLPVNVLLVNLSVQRFILLYMTFSNLLVDFLIIRCVCVCVYVYVWVRARVTTKEIKLRGAHGGAS
jgi:hypothetical protein